MISHRHKCIFIHIPKCGGTSIEDILFKPLKERTTKDLWMLPNEYQTGGLQHLMSSHIIEEVGGDIFSKYFTFSFVRNPWDKMVSQYNYTIAKRKDLLDHIGITKSASFEEYINCVSSTEIFVQWDQQYKFLYINKKCVVDFIGRFENLQEDFNVVCNKIGIPQQQLPHKNATKHKHYTEYYDDETRQIVAEKYAKDIEYFGYEFGENTCK